MLNCEYSRLAAFARSADASYRRIHKRIAAAGASPRPNPPQRPSRTAEAANSPQTKPAAVAVWTAEGLSDFLEKNPATLVRAMTQFPTPTGGVDLTKLLAAVNKGRFVL